MQTGRLRERERTHSILSTAYKISHSRCILKLSVEIKETYNVQHGGMYVQILIIFNHGDNITNLLLSVCLIIFQIGMTTTVVLCDVLSLSFYRYHRGTPSVSYPLLPSPLLRSLSLLVRVASHTLTVADDQQFRRTSCEEG